ncbi:hypothetical protein [Marinibacterium sp. SX1]|uniref:hypothetical protein n=1 Tax=Marinibacterium sp. SX1 TaxID=3388424 RepID=UPI003D17C914
MFISRAAAGLASISLAVAPLIAGPLAAQTAPGALYTVVVPAGQFGSSAYLTHVLQGLSAARAFCAALNDETLNVDCLAERLAEIGEEVPDDTDYVEIRSILNDTADQLADLARTNRDSGRSRVTASQPGQEPGTIVAQTTRPLVPVRPETLAAVNSQAVAILEETETLLLRSAASGEQSTQYARIADALDSNKVLLRSA